MTDDRNATQIVFDAHMGWINGELEVDELLAHVVPLVMDNEAKLAALMRRVDELEAAIIDMGKGHVLQGPLLSEPERRHEQE